MMVFFARNIRMSGIFCNVSVPASVILINFEDMRPFLTCILIFLLSAQAHAQREFVYFYGKIIDQSTEKPLSGVNISFQGLKMGYATDKEGEFSFFIDTIPVYMVISHLGYATKKIWLDGTSQKLSIRLSPSALQLKEVEVVAKAGPEPFYKDNTYSVLDYAVDTGRVYILIYRFSVAQSEILCKSMDGRLLASSGRLTFKPDSLFKDCLRNVHVLGHDSCYQLFADTVGVHLVFPNTLEKFENILQNCVASTETKLFFKKVTNDGFGVDFYRVDRLTSVSEKMVSVVDEENLKRLRRNLDDYARIRSSTIPEGRSEFQEWSFARKIMYKPKTASMVRIGESICIFNTADMTIEFYTPDGDFTSKVRLDVSRVRDGRWTKEIYVDVVRQRAYTSFSRSGEYTLYRVNLETGELEKSTRLAFVFPQRVRVNDGKVFYLYNVPGEQDNKQLFRQTLTGL